MKNTEKKTGPAADRHPPSTVGTTRRIFLRHCLGAMAAIGWVHRAVVQAANGDPDQFTKSMLYFTNATGDQVWQLPYDMTGEFAEPVQLKT